MENPIQVNVPTLRGLAAIMSVPIEEKHKVEAGSESFPCSVGLSCVFLLSDCPVFDLAGVGCQSPNYLITRHGEPSSSPAHQT